jgi:hypothetical protein
MPDYRCPTCDFNTESIGSWKRHQTRMHSGWDDVSLADVLGASASTEPVADRMNNFAETMPENAQEVPIDGTNATADTVNADVPPIPDVRRIRGTPKKLKKLMAQIPEVIFDRNGIILDAEDKQAVEEAIEFMENVFGVEFQVPASKYVVESRFYAFLWPLGVIVFILIKHKLEHIFTGANFSANPKNGDGGEVS